MNTKFNVWDYMVKEFGEMKSEAIANKYEAEFGENGLDYLWSLESEEEVKEVLQKYI